MKSTGDPILDLQALCKDHPHSEDDLRQAYEKLGWGPPFGVVLGAANGTYVVKRDDGLYHPRDGNTREVFSKALQPLPPQEPSVPLTQTERLLLSATTSDDSWNAACLAIKTARGGKYPPDWFEIVIKGGLAQRQAETW